MRGVLTIAKMNSLASLSQGMLSQKQGCLGDRFFFSPSTYLKNCSKLIVITFFRET